MANIRIHHLLYLFLAGICFALAFYSGAIQYTVPATTDKVEIFEYNIDYLSQLTLRHDRMLEIIYFGFLAVLFSLSYWCGRMHSKVMMLEGKVEQLVRASKMMSGVPTHPAYGNFSMGREVERLRRKALMEKIKELRELNDKNAANLGPLRRPAELPIALDAFMSGLSEPNDKNATYQVPFRRPTAPRSALDVLATQLEVQKMEAKLINAMTATSRKDEKEEMAPPAYRHEDKVLTEKDSKAGDV